MSAKTVGELQARVRASPIEHLGERSPRTLWAYECGYDAGLFHHGCEPLVDELAYGLNDWVRARVRFADEHASRINAYACVSASSYALLLAADETEALAAYLDLWNQALR